MAADQNFESLSKRARLDRDVDESESPFDAAHRDNIALAQAPIGINDTGSSLEHVKVAESAELGQHKIKALSKLDGEHKHCAGGPSTEQIPESSTETNKVQKLSIKIRKSSSESQRAGESSMVQNTVDRSSMEHSAVGQETSSMSSGVEPHCTSSDGRLQSPAQDSDTVAIKHTSTGDDVTSTQLVTAALEPADDESDNMSDISNISGTGTEESWKPTSGPMSWIQEQMMTGQDPRSVLHELISSGVNIPDQLDDLTLWKIIINLLTEPPRRRKLKTVNTLDDVVSLIQKSSKIMVLTGAGVSVSCGIPDFRSRDGIYARLSVDFPDLPDPQAMFDISYFIHDQRPFFKFAKEIYPGQFKPSKCHEFIQLIESQGRLLRNYTQNIDTLEQVAGIKNVVQCHGSFATATCMSCKHKMDAEAIREDIFTQTIPRCPVCPKDMVLAVMKPDIVFFGEGLSQEFHRQMAADKNDCDLLIIIGSSLKVRPVALIPSSLPAEVPQILINREPLPHLTFDVQLLGNCDVIVDELCRRLGSPWSRLSSDSLSSLHQIRRDELTTPPLPEIRSPSLPELKTPPLPDLTTPSLPELKTLPLPDLTTPSLPELKTLPLPDLTTLSLPELKTPPLPEIRSPSLPELKTPPSPDLTTPPIPEIRSSSLPELKTPPSPDLTTPPIPDTFMTETCGVSSTDQHRSDSEHCSNTSYCYSERASVSAKHLPNPDTNHSSSIQDSGLVNRYDSSKVPHSVVSDVDKKFLENAERSRVSTSNQIIKPPDRGEIADDVYAKSDPFLATETDSASTATIVCRTTDEVCSTLTTPVTTTDDVSTTSDAMTTIVCDVISTGNVQSVQQRHDLSVQDDDVQMVDDDVKTGGQDVRTVNYKLPHASGTTTDINIVDDSNREQTSEQKHIHISHNHHRHRYHSSHSLSSESKSESLARQYVEHSTSSHRPSCEQNIADHRSKDMPSVESRQIPSSEDSQLSSSKAGSQLPTSSAGDGESVDGAQPGDGVSVDGAQPGDGVSVDGAQPGDDESSILLNREMSGGPPRAAVPVRERCSISLDADAIQQMWQSPQKQCLAAQLKDNEYLFLPPHRYIFHGAEVYSSLSDDSDSELDDSSSVDSASDDSGLDMHGVKVTVSTYREDDPQSTATRGINRDTAERVSVTGRTGVETGVDCEAYLDSDLCEKRL